MDVTEEEMAIVFELIGEGVLTSRGIAYLTGMSKEKVEHIRQRIL